MDNPPLKGLQARRSRETCHFHVAEAEESESDEYKAKFQAALPLLEKYLTIKEQEPAIWDLLGKVYANLGMAEKSKEAFEKADLYR